MPEAPVFAFLGRLNRVAHKMGPVRVRVLALSLIVIVGLALRLMTLTRASLWLDEGFTLFFASHTLEVIFGQLARTDPNSPLYILIVKAWTGLFGTSTFAVRLLPALVSACTAPLIYLAVKKAAPGGRGYREGLLAALMFELCFYQLHLGQELRAYAFLIFNCAGSIAMATCIIRAEQNPEGQPPTLKVRGIHAAGLGFFMAGAVWSHYTSLAFLAILGSGMALWWLFVTRRSVRVFWQLALAAILFFLASAMAFSFILTVSQTVMPTFWLTARSIEQVVETTTLLFGAAFDVLNWKLDVLVRIALFAIWPVLGIRLIFTTPDSATRWCLSLFVALSIGFWAVMLILTYTVQPIFMNRTLSPIQIGWIGLSAIGVWHLPQARVRHYGVAAIIAVWALGALSYELKKPSAIYSEDWRQMARLVAQESTPDDVVGVMSIGGYIMDYYSTRLGEPQAFQAICLPELTLSNSQILDAGQHARALAAALDAGQLDWVIIRDDAEREVITRELTARGYMEPTYITERLAAYRID